ncbi:MAG: GIY-YIG catalytic domain protein [Candidatus Azambacteria bacterium GW2011_GWC2_45_7b]|uniref:GIY-YIG catalytic domain protein n=3 Tax=Parcubacteria group TaxID=1794811 RepID=A0A837IH65_9BACT|nr:MAG: GIY-YIG catalytic domain protein [Parcubacteria group bacterium GW2011_GWC1_44_10]KKT60270.1 MAG: GIY-YIG catalytic domain protein [Candidatus Giovannonibacteria bacterium GW2011_GWA1_44_25]KKU12761.1 MAG: GIY-YIG catalytic domain protein [Candidatus Azambacteria bacterium GW2011_GWC2_45_7b]
MASIKIMFYVYVLKSLKNGRNYVGFTEDLKQRVSEHNSGKGGGYSSKNRPFKLIYYEAYLDKKDATAGEKFYKTGYGREVLKGKLKNYLTE